MVPNADYYGSIAAIRSLGRRGVEARTVAPSRFVPGRFSRFVREHLRSPPFEMTSAFAEWLLRQGRAQPRHVIYATSDAVLLALAQYRDEISEFYDLYQPPLSSILPLLDKGRLKDEARAAGMSMPDTWTPRDRDEVRRIARDVEGPFLVKPRSQLAVSTYSKGAIAVLGGDALLSAYDAIVATGPHDPGFAVRYPELLNPLVQRYHVHASEAIYSLSGFRDASGQNVAIRAANKVLQVPWRLGVGICFESAAVDEALAKSVLNLCERVGYYGAFEVEFILVDGQPLLIDFNCRFYNQMAFDIARGVDVPGFVYAGATGDAVLLNHLMEAARAPLRGEHIFCNALAMKANLLARRAVGTMTGAEAAAWKQWARGGTRQVVDAVKDDGDGWPAVADVARYCSRLARHPRAFVEQARAGR